MDQELLTLGHIRLAVVVIKSTPKLVVSIASTPIQIGLPGMHKELGAFLVKAGQFFLSFQPAKSQNDLARECLNRAFRIVGDETGIRTGDKFSASEKATLREMVKEGRHAAFAKTLVHNAIPNNDDSQKSALVRELILMAGQVMG